MIILIKNKDKSYTVESMQFNLGINKWEVTIEHKRKYFRGYASTIEKAISLAVILAESQLEDKGEK